MVSCPYVTLWEEACEECLLFGGFNAEGPSCIDLLLHDFSCDTHFDESQQLNGSVDEIDVESIQVKQSCLAISWLGAC